MGGSKRRNKKKFYPVVTSDGTKIFEVWEDCLTFMKGKKKVKQKGFIDRKDAEEFIKTHTKQDKSSFDDSRIGEDKDSQEKHISMSSEEHHISICSEEEMEQEEYLNREIETEKFSLPDCCFDGGDESSEEMINCDICGGWCHLTCVDLTPEKAKELAL